MKEGVKCNVTVVPNLRMKVIYKNSNEYFEIKRYV
jgi:hypothetical protein